MGWSILYLCYVPLSSSLCPLCEFRQDVGRQCPLFNSLNFTIQVKPACREIIVLFER